jgi:hypothetical protein
MLGGRIFEHTDNRLRQQFQSGGRVDWNALAQLPALFMDEGKADEIAKVGRIIRARPSNREVVLEYTYDPDVPRITNKRLVEPAMELDIEEFEFYRTHWAVKDIDLFQVMLRHMQPRRPSPKVFTISDPEMIEPSLVSAMMPFDPTFAAVHAAITDAAEAAGLRYRRADDIWENPAVIQDVVSLIDRSKLVVCDCTGRNTNVFYEIGIAHTLGRDVVLLTQHEGDIPFDLRHLRYLKYLNNGEGLAKLTQQLYERLGDLAGS